MKLLFFQTSKCALPRLLPLCLDPFRCHICHLPFSRRSTLLIAIFLHSRFVSSFLLLASFIIEEVNKWEPIRVFLIRSPPVPVIMCPFLSPLSVSLLSFAPRTFVTWHLSHFRFPTLRHHFTFFRIFFSFLVFVSFSGLGPRLERTFESRHKFSSKSTACFPKVSFFNLRKFIFRSYRKRWELVFSTFSLSYITRRFRQIERKLWKLNRPHIDHIVSVRPGERSNGNYKLPFRSFRFILWYCYNFPRLISRVDFYQTVWTLVDDQMYFSFSYVGFFLLILMFLLRIRWNQQDSKKKTSICHSFIKFKDARTQMYSRSSHDSCKTPVLYLPT